MGCHHLKVLIPAVISALLLWEGVQCRSEGYSVDVRSQVTVQDGLCVHIPCRFTYVASDYDPHAPLFGSWYREDKQSRNPTLVATNKPDKIHEIDSHTRHRFEMSGPMLSVGDCSLTINDAEPADKATYHFRMDKGNRGYTYGHENEKVSVIVAERKIDIKIAGPMRAGQRESIICETQRCPYLEVPKITWTHTSQISAQESSTVSHETMEGRMNFIPAKADHQQNVTCTVTYGKGSGRRSARKTIALNIAYPPSIPRFSAEVQYPDGFVRKLPNVTSEIVARVGDTLLVHCETDANPASSQTWARLPLPSITQEHVSNNVLKISNLHVDHEGDYECLAKNYEGSSRAVFYLRVTGYNYATKA